tara:strand:+ start:5651 stop:6199 length:549 start_codon:yes stop_codon:yes gene_type:complete
MKFNLKKNRLTLVSGPSRGGKSSWAEYLISKHNSVTYIATSSNYNDSTWKERIEIHKKRRPKSWNLIEDPSNLEESIKSINKNNSILIDSLGGFVYKYIDLNCEDWNRKVESFIYCLKEDKRYIIIVIEETGWGIIPHTSIGNIFRDRIGSLSQKLESISNQSWLVIQGRAINLKKISLPVT